MKSYTIKTTASWSRTQSDLAREFKLWGVTEWDTNYPRGARLEGMNQTEKDKTVTLTYLKNGKTISLSMAKQARAVDNLRVLYLAVESMRMNEKRGIGEVIESAYLQLAAPEMFNPYQVLQVYPGSPLEVCEAAYRHLAKSAHPDKGGSAEIMQKLNRAIAEIRKEEK